MKKLNVRNMFSQNLNKARKFFEDVYTESQSERRIISLAAREAWFLFTWPIVTFIGTFFASKFLHSNFWPEVIAVIAIIGIILYVVNIEGVRYRKDFGKRLRNLLIILTGGFNLLAVSNTCNNMQNSLPLVIYVIGAILLTLSYVLIIKGWSSDSYYNERFRSHTYYIGITALLIIPVILMFFGEIWFHFGSQFIWVPVIVAVSFFSFSIVKDGRELTIDNFKKGGVGFYGILTFSLLGIISTLHQFWSSRIVWGINLWHLIAGLGGIIIIFAIYFTIDYFKTKKKVRLDMEEASRKETEEKRIEEEEIQKKKAETQEKYKLILGKAEPTWEDVFFVYEFNSSKVNKFGEMYERIFALSFLDLLTISKVKKQIVWNGSKLDLALEIIEGITKHTFDDKLIDKVLNQVSKLVMEECAKFDGYDELWEKITKKCPKIIELRNG
jgi:hypothetical protein